jgi:hypothetical protein
VTTPEYAPRLRERREREIALAEDARDAVEDEAEEYFALFYERDGLNIPNLLYQQGTRH